jgi:hypothetical protein
MLLVKVAPSVLCSSYLKQVPGIIITNTEIFDREIF